LDCGGFHGYSGGFELASTQNQEKSLENKEFKWGYSPSKSFYIGYKLTLAIDYHSRKPLTFLIHEGSSHDSKSSMKFLKS
jgi:hypothetical protein